MQFRHEVKHEISPQDLEILRKRLGAVMHADSRAVNGRYEIRSLYFDTADDRALREKTDGIQIREKYRIRMYNHDPSFCRLERKFKCGNLGYKESAVLTAEQVQSLIDGSFQWRAGSTDSVICSFYERIRHEGLSPKVIVDYTREPFVFLPGNVRVTLDHHIRTAQHRTDFFNPSCLTLPVPDSPCILEVKWDNFLPDVIRNAVQLENRHSSAYSKYAACRTYD